MVVGVRQRRGLVLQIMADPYLFIRACEQTRLIDRLPFIQELFDSADVGGGFNRSLGNRCGYERRRASSREKGRMEGIEVYFGRFGLIIVVIGYILCASAVSSWISMFCDRDTATNIRCRVYIAFSVTADSSEREIKLVSGWECLSFRF